MNITRYVLALTALISFSIISMEEKGQDQLSPFDAIKQLIGEFSFLSTSDIQEMQQGDDIRLSSGERIVPSRDRSTLLTIITTVEKK